MRPRVDNERILNSPQVKKSVGVINGPSQSGNRAIYSIFLADSPILLIGFRFCTYDHHMQPVS